MKSLDSILLLIKENPDKYIGRKSIKMLSLFINGYALSQYNETDVYHEVLKGFQEFVQNKYNTMIAKNWAEIILFYSISDEQAFDNFYYLLEEFRKTEEMS